MKISREEYLIMQARMKSKGVPQDPDLEILRKRQKLQDLHDKYFAHRACEDSRGAQVPVQGRASSGSSCASTRETPKTLPSRPATPERDLRKRADAPQDILPRPQCSSGTTQSRPYPARAVKVMESARPLTRSQTRAGAEKPEDESPETGQQSVTRGRESPTNSALEDRFYDLWLACGGPALCREHRIFGSRKWRADFAHLQSQTIIEIDGGVWKPGGHNMQGHARDCERDLECVLNGWRVVRLVPSMITVENIERLIAFMKGNQL